MVPGQSPKAAATSPGHAAEAEKTLPIQMFQEVPDRKKTPPFGKPQVRD